MTKTELAKAYLENYRDPEKYPDLDIEHLAELELSDPIQGLEFIYLVISETSTDEEIAYVAAGPLENLFCKFYDVIYDPLKVMVRKDPKMRKAMRGIWTSDKKTRAALDKLLGEFNLRYGSF